MYIAILGRQPALGMAELEAIYGAANTRWFSDQAAIIDTNTFSIDRIGGTQKAGYIALELRGDWRQVSMKIVQEYSQLWARREGKITLGISAYGFSGTSPRDIQKTGIVLKQKLKNSGVSLRLIPNPEAALNTATSHHNKLGLSANKVELLVVRNRDGKVIIAESIGAQNITAYTKRDQNRPKRDAFVGMLPPKLAQIMINLASFSLEMSSRSSIIASKHLQPEGESTSGLDLTLGAKPFASDDSGKGERKNIRLLDPFCGTGVVLQEAALLGYHVYGSDLSDKMIDYTRANLEWLAQTHRIDIHVDLHQADARTAQWQQPINIVACESYLGQPFSAPPSPSKLAEVRGNCNQIISEFLKNIGPQLDSGTQLCVAVPAWRSSDGSFTHLPLIGSLDQLGYKRRQFKNVKDSDLLYYRENQVVARELLVLVKT
jgi:tRNA (guanine10-N2)-dimethyltransferase